MFIQDDFDIPDNLVTEQFRFVVLEQSLTEIDYEAVMSSKQRLKHVFAEHDDCEVYLWVADDELHSDSELFESTDRRLKTEWPFTHPAYPGRTISWTDWNPDYPPEPMRKAR